jgi:DNA polymerase (family 10)
MANREIAEIFNRMSRALTFKGLDHFRALAYERAARALRGEEEDVTKLARENRLNEIPGIGKDLSEMINEYIATGHIRRIEREVRSVPDELLELMRLVAIVKSTT